jgi:hypothetical protein
MYEVVVAAAFFRGARAAFAPVFRRAGGVGAGIELSAACVSALLFPLSARFEAIAFQSFHRVSSRAFNSRIWPGWPT